MQLHLPFFKVLTRHQAPQEDLMCAEGENHHKLQKTFLKTLSEDELFIIQMRFLQVAVRRSQVVGVCARFTEVSSSSKDTQMSPACLF